MMHLILLHGPPPPVFRQCAAAGAASLKGVSNAVEVVVSVDYFYSISVGGRTRNILLHLPFELNAVEVET